MTTTLTISPVNHDDDHEDKGKHYDQYDSQGSYQQAGYQPMMMMMITMMRSK